MSLGISNLDSANRGIAEGAPRDAAAQRPVAAHAGDPGQVAFDATPQFGVALFDNPRDMSAGWACRAGEPPFPFSSVADLSNDTIWVSALDWDEYRLRAQRLSNLRRIDYLRSSLTSIAADLGRRITGEFARESSAVLAKVVRQAMLIAINVYGWESPASDLRGDVLSDDVRRTLPPPPKPQQHTRAALLSAYQDYSTPDWPPAYEPDTISVTLRYNRLEYARKIMGTLVPDDAWTYLPPEQAASLPIETLLNPAQPTLVEAVVELGSIDPSMASLIAFGATASRRSALRKWISQPELAWLSRHAKVRVSSALVARSARPLPASVQLPPKLLADPLFSLSISAGLVAESHWYSIASTIYNRALRTKEASSWAVWLRAMDRSLSFALAHKAHDAGFRVSGYGNGSVVLRLQRARLQDCLEFAEANNIAHPAFHPIFAEHGGMPRD